MKTAICVNLGRDHIYKCDNVFIGRSGENESTQFQIKLEECLCDSWVYIDFVKPDGTKYKTPRLDIVDNMVTYDIANELLTMNGTLKVQIVLQNEEGVIWKSTVKTYEIIQSIDAINDIPIQEKEDFITEAQKVLNQIENGLTPTIGENGNWFVGDRDTGKPSQGEDGFTPVKGVDYFDGKDGVDGVDGYTPIKGVDYFDGKDGAAGKDGYSPIKGVDYFDGKDGAAGKDGVDGYTPVKGTDYFTDADVEEMVNSAIESIKNQNIYVDKEEIEEYIKSMPIDGVLRNKGHVDSIEELPALSQQSGEVGEHPSTFEIDYTKTDVEVNIADLPNLTTLNGINTPYVFGFYVDSENYFFVSTDNPELIDGFSYSLDGNFNIYTKQGTSPETNFKVYHACYNGMFNTMLPAGDPDGNALFLPDMGASVADFNAGVEYAAMCIPHPPIMGDHLSGIAMAYLGGKGSFRIFGNLPTTVKYRPHLRYALKTVDGQAMPPTSWEYLPEDATRDSLTLAFKNNYTYTEGMEALRFDEQGNAYWITDEDGAKENDVATVGKNNEMHVVNNYGEWEQWNKHETASTNEFLCNKGHFDDEESLPSDGQESGTRGSYPRTFSSDPTISEVTIPTNTLYPYIFGVILNDSNYLYVATSFPEVIKSMAYGSDGSYEIYFEATSDKPVAVYYKRGLNSGAYCIPDSYTGSYGARDNQRTNGTEIYVPSTLTGYLSGSGTAKIFGNLPNKIKYKAHTYYAYARTSSGTSGYTYNQITDATSDSLTLAFADNYTYNEGMNMLRFDENYQAYWITDESEVKPNDVATVGENNKIHIVDSNGKWKECNKTDSYTKAEINAMLGEIENVLDEILGGEPVVDTPLIPDVG